MTLAGRGFPLIIFTQPAVSIEPSKGSFDDPSPGYDMKPLAFLLLDNFNYTVEFFFSPFNKFFTFIGTIRPNFFHRVHDGKQHIQDLFGRMTVINVCRMDDDNDRVTCCINHNMPLSTLNQLPPIESRFL